MELWRVQHLEWYFWNLAHCFEGIRVLLDISIFSQELVQSFAVLNINHILLLTLLEAKDALAVLVL